MLDRAAFLSIVGALAAGGGGGYMLHQQMADKAHANDDAAQKQKAALDDANARAARAEDQARAASAMLTSAPVCDDSVGAAGDCPAPGLPNASDEGLCGGHGSVAAHRCQDFKTSMKPKVAQNAVACLNALKGNEACDADRVALCGHEALMLACQEPTPPNQSQVTSTNVNTSPPAPATSPPSPVASQCDAILKSCSTSPLGVTLADCYRTMSGLNDVGRANMVTCMAKHCSDKGFTGCEALPPPPGP
ncbi:MAG: hypothetical protein ACRELY_15390 [Polyangiaceae bacterium]